MATRRRITKRAIVLFRFYSAKFANMRAEPLKRPGMYFHQITYTPGALRYSAHEFENIEKWIDVSPLLEDALNYAVS
jgi:hypothetical protein